MGTRKATAAKDEAPQLVQAVELHTTVDDKPTEMMDLFSIDDVTYQIPKKPRVNLALKYLWHTRQFGEDRAAAELLESLLGEKGFKALCEYDDLEPDDFIAILTVAQEVTLGAMEDVRGNSGRGPGR